jgi:hypothetical protein
MCAMCIDCDDFAIEMWKCFEGWIFLCFILIHIKLFNA